MSSHNVWNRLEGEGGKYRMTDAQGQAFTAQVLAHTSTLLSRRERNFRAPKSGMPLELQMCHGAFATRCRTSKASDLPVVYDGWET
jgi:hypothetical protein